jgi:hypothetical protein
MSDSVKARKSQEGVPLVAGSANTAHAPDPTTPGPVAGTDEGRAARAALRGRALARRATRAGAAGWALLRARKVLAAGTGAGIALAGACFTAGRRSVVRHFGPVTRVTGGRI